MEKRGSGHLEMILAFTIFLVVVVFVLIYIRPLETNKLSEVAVVSLKNEFVSNVGITLSILFINGNETERCLPSSISEDLRNLNSTYKNVSGSSTNYYIFFSEEISGRLIDCTKDSLVGSVSKKETLSNIIILDMQEKYYSDYSGLKEDLKVPAVLNFEIYTIEGEYNMTYGEIGEVDIIAKSYVLSVINSEGELINNEFVLKIW